MNTGSIIPWKEGNEHLYLGRKEMNTGNIIPWKEGNEHR